MVSVTLYSIGEIGHVLLANEISDWLAGVASRSHSYP